MRTLVLFVALVLSPGCLFCRDWDPAGAGFQADHSTFHQMRDEGTARQDAPAPGRPPG